MKTLLAHWKIIAIVILSIGIGILLTRSCRKQPVDNSQVTIKDLQSQNKVVAAAYNKLYDSTQTVILEKEKSSLELTKQLNYISEKYYLLRNSKPDKDTVIRVREVYRGLECCEKLPILQAQVSLKDSIIGGLKFMNIKKDEQIKFQAVQFDRAVVISESQAKELKKAQRKTKWLRIGLVSETVVVFGGLIYLLAGK